MRLLIISGSKIDLNHVNDTTLMRENVPICGFKLNKTQYILCSILSRVALKIVIIHKSIYLTVSPLKCVPFVLKNDSFLRE